MCCLVFVRAFMHLYFLKDFLENTKNMVKIENTTPEYSIYKNQNRKHDIRYQGYFDTASMPNYQALSKNVSSSTSGKYEVVF